MGATPPRVFHHHIETKHTCSTWSVDVHVVWGLSSHYFFYQLFLLFRHNFFQIRPILKTFWTQFRLEVSTNHFETMHTCSTWSVNVHVVLILSSHYFYQLFPLFLLSFFPGSISIRIDTLWAQLFLEFSSDHFETMHTCFT